MMTHKFERDPESGMILIPVVLEDVEYELRMALDTGATRTTFDFNALHVAGYPIFEMNETGKTEKGAIETAIGIIEVGIFEAKNISALGQTVRDLKVQVYDFLKHGIISDYDGVLGLDFFEDTEFTINMKNQTIEVKTA